MTFTRTALAIGLALLSGGCGSYEVRAVVGTEREPFTGLATPTGGSGGRIEMSNGKGTECIGDFVMSGSAGHGFVSCNDGQQAALQLRSLGMTSGYGYGTTNTGRAIRFYVGLTPAEGAKYIGGSGVETAAAPDGEAKTRSTGTGFFVTRQGDMVTNAHVVNDCKEVAVARAGGSVPATIIAKDRQNDLALLRVNTQVTSVAALRAGRQVRQGETVVAYGFPLTGLMSSGGALTTGTVSALTGIGDDARFLQVSTQIQPGNSGGPLMDATGAVAGVTTLSLNDAKLMRVTGSVPQNVNFAIKVDVVRTFLESAGVAVEQSTAGRELSLPDIGEKARTFTARVECKR